jgi:HD-like signal output (HDOD) protein
MAIADQQPLNGAELALTEPPLGAALPLTLAERLLAMAQTEDFPALSAQVMRIQNLAGSDREKLQGLTDEILKDVALTKKLLRLANSVQYARHGEGVTTISRAVNMLGFSTVRNLSLTLVLLEHLSHKGQQHQVWQAYQQALLSATLASALSSDAQQAEEVFLGALFQGLGGILLACYFPQEAAQLQALMEQSPKQALQHERQILGAELDELTLAVARSWNFPTRILGMMRVHKGPLPSRPPRDPVQAMHHLATVANQAAHQILNPEVPLGQRKAHLEAVSRHCARLLRQPLEQMQNGVLKACQELRGIAVAIGQAETAPLQQMLAESEPTSAMAPVPSKPKPEPTQPPRIPTKPIQASAPPVAGSEDGPLWRQLALGLERANQVWLGGSAQAASEAQQELLEAFFKAIGCQTLVLCWRAEREGCMVGVQGLGQGADALTQAFRIALDGKEDLFALLCAALRAAARHVDRARQPRQCARPLARLVYWPKRAGFDDGAASQAGR